MFIFSCFDIENYWLRIVIVDIYFVLNENEDELKNWPVQNARLARDKTKWRRFGKPLSNDILLYRRTTVADRYGRLI